MDPETGKAADKFVLEGVYLEFPAPLTTSDAPTVVLLCSEGRLVRQYGVVRSILWNGGAKIDAVIDGGKKKSSSADVMASRDSAVTGDPARRTFSTFDLHNILPELLHGKSIRMAVQDDYGSNYHGPPLPQLLLEFHMPDPAPIVSKCGLKL
jgi:hypothetical protein